MPLDFSSLSDPSLERRFRGGIGEALSQRSNRRLAAARQPLNRQEGGANVGLIGGPVSRGGMFGDRAAAQAQQQMALGDVLGRERSVSMGEEAQARAQFDRARLQELIAEQQKVADAFRTVSGLAGSGVTLGVASGKAIDKEEKRKKREAGNA